MPSPPSKPRAGHVLQVLLAAGICGFWMGAVVHGSWQVAVEHAQILSGAVEYPWHTPYYIYHVRTWSILNQLGALLMWLGLSEGTLSILYSGLMVMFLFQGLALMLLAITRDRILAVAGPIFIWWVYPSSGYGDAYPIILAATHHTFGQMGLALLLLALALPGVGWHRIGGFLGGVLPAVHPILGLLGWLILVLALWTGGSYTHSRRRSFLVWFGAGAALAVATAAYHFGVTCDVEKLPQAEAWAYLQLFVPWEEYHRQAVPLDGAGVILNLLAAGLCLAWLARHRDSIPRSGRLLLRGLAAAGLVGLIFAVLSHWGMVELDRWAPARLLNLNILAFLGVVMGLLASRSQDARSQAMLAGLVVALPILMKFGSTAWLTWTMAAVGLSMLLRPWLERTRWPWAAITSAACLGPGLLLLRQEAAQGWGILLVILGGLLPLQRIGQAAIPTVGWAAIPRTLLLTVLTATACFGSGRALLYPLWHGFGEGLQDADTQALEAAAAGRGILLYKADGAHLIQLRTRRPVLTGDARTSFTMVPYVPEVAPGLLSIWKDLYGMDPQNIPDSTTGPDLAALLAGRQKQLWESWSTEQWMTVGRKYHATEVLVSLDWDLDLPRRFEGRTLILYAIPEGPP